MYQALYRKWRPKTFDEVVGQSHITDTLRRQVAEGRVGHAYLFTGTRGTGKTTCARILAKAVNCLAPQNGAPCCRCEACRSIDEGRALDVTELDAASNNGVDQVRALREEAVYTPSVLRKRVYIIDEVHMLSTAAFNALLKILEEPPEHLLFILATTELHKVPATILSRCQRFSFKRILSADAARQLSAVAKAEGIDLTPDGAELLARMAGGALRDALSLLDQCRAAEGALDTAAIREVLGLAGSLQTAELMERILRRDAAGTLELFDRLYQDGKDTLALLGELADLGRDLTICRAAPEGGDALLSGHFDKKTLSELGQGYDLKRFLFLTETVQSCRAALPGSFQPRIDAELCLLKLCDESLCGDLTALEARLARLESQGLAAAPSPAPAPRPAPAARKMAPPKEEERPVSGTEAGEMPLPKVEAPPEPVASPPEKADGNLWHKLLDQYKGRLSVKHRAFLNMATGVLSGDTLKVYCQSPFVCEALNDNGVLSVLREVTAAAVGGSVRVELTVGAPAAQAAPVGEEQPATGSRLEDLAKRGSQLGQFEIK